MIIFRHTAFKNQIPVLHKYTFSKLYI